MKDDPSDGKLEKKEKKQKLPQFGQICDTDLHKSTKIDQETSQITQTGNAPSLCRDVLEEIIKQFTILKSVEDFRYLGILSLVCKDFYQFIKNQLIPKEHFILFVQYSDLIQTFGGYHSLKGIYKCPIVNIGFIFPREFQIQKYPSISLCSNFQNISKIELMINCHVCLDYFSLETTSGYHNYAYETEPKKNFQFWFPCVTEPFNPRITLDYKFFQGGKILNPEITEILIVPCCSMKSSRKFTEQHEKKVLRKTFFSFTRKKRHEQERIYRKHINGF